METVDRKIIELMHGKKKRLLSTVYSYIGKGIQHASHQSASWLSIVLCPLAENINVCKAVFFTPFAVQLAHIKY